MNFDQIVNMITRLFIRKAVNTGVRKGLDMANRRGKVDAGKAEGGKAAGASPQDTAEARAARDMAKRARKAAQLTRRLGR